MWLDHTSDDYEERCAAHLLRNRRILKMEMQKACQCFTTEQKLKLKEEWKKKYSPTMFNDLMNIAKDMKARYTVSMWDVDTFDVSKHQLK